MQNGQASNQNEVKESRHPILKKIFIFFMFVFMLTYFSSLAGRWVTAQKTKDAFSDVNSLLTKSKINIDKVILNPYSQDTTIIRLKLYNPPNHISPYAFDANEVIIKRGVNSKKAFGTDNPQQVFDQLFTANIKASDVKNLMQTSSKLPTYVPEVRLKGVTINYDINSNKKINLYQILNNMVKELTPGDASKPLDIFNTNREAEITYTGRRFEIDKLVIEKPTINIYNNRNLIKSLEINDIEMNFKDLKQPTTYGHVMLASSFKAIKIIDSAIRNR